MKNPDEELKVYRDFFTNIAVGLFLASLTILSISEKAAALQAIQISGSLIGALISLQVSAYLARRIK